MNRHYILHGLGVSPGIGIGRVFRFSRSAPLVDARKLGKKAAHEEQARYERAIERATHELDKVIRLASRKVGDAHVAVFEAQREMVTDEVLVKKICKRIEEEELSAAVVVDSEYTAVIRQLKDAHNALMRERAEDMIDVRDRILRHLLDEEKWSSKIEGEVVIVAETLSPADTVVLSRNKVLAYAVDTGGPTSHAAMLARALGIPATISLGDAAALAETGDEIIVDGYEGIAIINPTVEEREEYKAKRERMLELAAMDSDMLGKRSETADGVEITLSMNLELGEELDHALAQNTNEVRHGAGLVRTEHLFFGDGEDFPREEQQYIVYKNIVDRLAPASVALRTFDVGGDKIFASTRQEDNPFLGWRGIRISLDDKKIFREQLRAILRASAAHKNVKIMFPMITTIGELREAKASVEEAKDELRAAGEHFDEAIKIGPMIEVPSAVFYADELARESDFFSIGTNDLTQYLLAADRGNELVRSLYNELEPAVLRAIDLVVRAAHRAKISVSVCGEMGGALHPLPVLLGLGIDEFSVSPSLIASVKRGIRSTDHTSATTLAQKILTVSTRGEVEELLREFHNK